MGFHFLLQGILSFQPRDQTCVALHWQVNSLLLSHQGSPVCMYKHTYMQFIEFYLVSNFYILKLYFCIIMIIFKIVYFWKQKRK